MAAPRRVTVVSPGSRVDVALPLECTVAELIPQLVRLSGTPPRSEQHPGWVLARLGGAPLAPGLTVSATLMQDGEILSLQPRPSRETPLVFDDAVDAIAGAAQTRAGPWRPRTGRRVSLLAALALFTGTTAFVAGAFRGSVLAPVSCALIAVALVVSGGALSRARGDVDAATATAAAGVPAALLAGATALPPHSLVGSLPLGLAAVTVYATTAAMLVYRFTWFAPIIAASALGAAITACVPLFDLPGPRIAAVAVALTAALTAAAPMISLRLARLPMPKVPADMDSFRADEQPTLGSAVLGPTTTATHILTGLVTALGIVTAGCCLVLLGDPSPWAPVLVAVVAIAWLLRSRSYAGTAQRVATIVIGLVLLIGLTTRLLSTLDADWLLAAGAGTALAGVACLYYAGHGPSAAAPIRARWLDRIEYLVLIALIPTAAAVLDLYNTIRDAVG
ncbi:type VII secretion integral membrane protein EccD [Saccharopolyspora antimicrobica]|uniref:Type VII secretion integral membrane protein EccD n=2 Tax=Saccharopolyspora TaxID=1835 RepID=A0A1I4U609_9PSEU|nr:type VII secretion integral membrane protein EccD [Saccharopolyspora antimicrobica]RKT88702.1 type VII secretion integral membrane protein EccD [Saccharopolyspora antimicrobica]SFM84466.1 type VII secretion integral membrane protein EccD [Saccharopolyspora antimicrobica]